MEESLEVNCYAGHRYPQRPISFVFLGRKHRVEEVLSSWEELSPQGRYLCFKVRSEGEVFLLSFDVLKKRWSLR